MKGENKYSSLYAIRIRSTLRFGSVNNQFVHCGDTTGAIWVFDLMKELERADSDVVNDLCITGEGDFYLVYQKKMLTIIAMIGIVVLVIVDQQVLDLVQKQ